MKCGDAAVFNLSLLTSDVFAVIAAKFIFHETLSKMYFVGFFAILIGLVIYNQTVPPSEPNLPLDADEKIEDTSALIPSQTRQPSARVHVDRLVNV